MILKIVDHYWKPVCQLAAQQTLLVGDIVYIPNKLVNNELTSGDAQAIVSKREYDAGLDIITITAQLD